MTETATPDHARRANVEAHQDRNKGKKGGKHLTHFYSLYYCRVVGWVFGQCLRGLQFFRFFPAHPITGPKEPETSLVFSSSWG